MIHIHRWGAWEDVAHEDESRGATMVAGIMLLRQRIRQKRRCSVCNRLETRAA